MISERANISFGVKLEAIQRGFGNCVAAAQGAAIRARGRREHEIELMVWRGRAIVEFEIDSRAREVRSSFDPNGIDRRRVAENTGQLSASK